MSFEDVNFLAVGAAAVLAFVLGALWYSPALLGRQWTAAHSVSEAQIKTRRSGATPAYLVSFVCWFVMALVLALVGPHFGEGPGAMLHMGLLLWLGFSATTGLTTTLFPKRSMRVWVIDAGYQVVSVSIMAVVLGLWR